MKAHMRTTLHIAVAVAVAAVISVPALAGSSTIVLDKPVAIGNQVFEAGELTFLPWGGPGLIAIRVGVRQVALVWLDASSDMSSRKLSVRFRRDEDGILHLISVRRGLIPRVSTETQMLRVSALAPGDSTLEQRQAAQRVPETVTARALTGM